MEIKGFTFWRSWHEQCELLDDTDRLAYMDAIRRYAFDGTVPPKDSVSPIVYALFLGVIPSVDSSIARHNAGAPKGNQNARKNKSANNTTENKSKQLIDSINCINSENNNKNLNLEFKEEVEGEFEEEEGEVSPLPPSKNSRFVPPSESEVADWLKSEKQLPERKAGRIAMRFVSFYESKGWMVGRNKMKSWKAAAAGWLARDRQSAEAAQERAQGMNAAQNMVQYQYRATESSQTHENGLGIVQMPEAMYDTKKRFRTHCRPASCV